MSNRAAAVTIVKELSKAGHTAFFAGGCVRDMLLRRKPKDYDVVTDANPEKIVKLFRRTLKVGSSFGVIVVLIGNQPVEVAVFRTESGYSDHRRPDQVRFCDAEQDALRRDFTINGMFYDPVKKQIYDYVDGQKDVQSGIIRTIGPAKKRFDEDCLRMLRAVRFSVQLGFEIETDTFKAVQKNAAKIDHISGERISMELQGIMSSPERANGFRLLEKSRLLKNIFGCFSTADVETGFAVLQNLPEKCDFPLALAAMFVDFKTSSALNAVKRLKLSNGYTQHLRFLLDNRNVLLGADMPLANLKKLLAKPFFRDLLAFETAIVKAQGKSLSALQKLKKRASQLKGKELQPKRLLNGHELMALGCPAGPILGMLSEEMYTAQLSEIIHTKHQARKWACKWLTEHKGLI